MKQLPIAFVFKTSPNQGLIFKQGIDALIGVSNFINEQHCLICFIGDAALALKTTPHSRLLLQKNYHQQLKMIDFFNFPHCFISEQSYQQFFKPHESLLIKAQIAPLEHIITKIDQCEQLLSF